ncbi:MAG: hypothetical protein HY867_15950 [Chloroflexi bacterium]|nr:hypothetical protein [Chloroflexota bacterium]
MQRSIRFLALTVFLALAACGGMPTVPPEKQTAAAPTTEPPTAVPIPPEKAIVTFTNEALIRLADPLSQTVDANYQMLDVHFTPSADGLTMTLTIDARCECANNANCCSLQRTFVVVVNAMKAVQGKIRAYIPINMGKVRLSCRDHSRDLGVAEATWADMNGYFSEAITGSQFGNRVLFSPAP